MSPEIITSQVLIIGSGAAGLRAAIAAREAGCETLVISKGRPGRGTSTLMSEGVFAGTRECEAPDRHRQQTLEAGRGLNDRSLVEVLVSEAPQRLREMVQWGMEGSLLAGYLFAQGTPPFWGEAIIRCLLKKATSLGVKFLPQIAVIGMDAAPQGIWVQGFRVPGGEALYLHGTAIVLATGGAGALYERHDNPQGMWGEGYALAYEAGAMLRDMEFVQFYPLGVAEPGQPPYVIPPRLADHGTLINEKGEELLRKYDITERPAAARARDCLSQALFREIQVRGGEVFLDLRNLTEDQWNRDPFSASVRELYCRRFGAKERLIRVAPMAHHVMGGVKTDTWGKTSIEGLSAAGEVTGGLHGANRMGGNALSETLVFGARAGLAAAQWVQAHGPPTRVQGRPPREMAASGRLSPRQADVPHKELLARLRRDLWMHGGILRDRKGLLKVQETVREIQSLLPPEGQDNLPGRLRERSFRLRLALRCAELILGAALRREESRGAHLREDFPQTDDGRFKGHWEVRKGSQGQTWEFRPIS